MALCREVCAEGHEPSGRGLPRVLRREPRLLPPSNAGTVVTAATEAPRRTHGRESSRGLGWGEPQQALGLQPRTGAGGARAGLTPGREKVGSSEITQLGVRPRLAPDTSGTTHTTASVSPSAAGPATPTSPVSGRRRGLTQYLCPGHLVARSTGTDAAAGGARSLPRQPPPPTFRWFLSQEAVRGACSVTFSSLEGSTGCLSVFTGRGIEKAHLENRFRNKNGTNACQSQLPIYVK